MYLFVSVIHHFRDRVETYKWFKNRLNVDLISKEVTTVLFDIKIRFTFIMLKVIRKYKRDGRKPEWSHMLCIV